MRNNHVPFGSELDVLLQARIEEQVVVDVEGALGQSGHDDGIVRCAHISDLYNAAFLYKRCFIFRSWRSSMTA